MTSERTTRTRRVTCFILLGIGMSSWCGCQKDATPITSENSKFEVADENSGAQGDVPRTSSTDSAVPVADPALVGSEPGRAEQRGQLANSAEQNAPPGSPPPKPSTQPPGTSPAPTAADGPDKLLAHIENLQNQNPRKATREETITNLLKIQRDIIDTANQLLADQSLDETKSLRAAEAKVQALTMLGQVQKEATTEMTAFVGELKKSPHKKLNFLARRLDFAQQMDAFTNGKIDIAKVVAQFNQLFADEPKEESLFRLSQQVTQIFLQTNHSKEAADLMKTVADAFKDSPNANLAQAAKMVREQVAMIELKLEEKFGAVLDEKGPQAEQEFLAVVDKLLQQPEASEITLQMISRMAQMLEGPQLALADKIYTKLVDTFSKHPTPELAKSATETKEDFDKRKAIIGQPFVVEGVTLDGKPFDWSKYKGKVVLVDYWATWCGPCLEEVPNIQQNYEQYHDKGFEVVGINLDDDPDAVRQFFARQRLPWPTLLSADPQKSGFENPMAARYNLKFIPFLVLVDRDGKAINFNLRGEMLGKKLATMFASAAGEKSGTQPGTSPAAQPGTPAAGNPLRTTPEKKSDEKPK